MTSWPISAIAAVVLGVVPDHALAHIMIAAVLAESGGDPFAVGDAGRSRGWYQIHDIHGLSAQYRHDPRASTEYMYTHEFQRAYQDGQARGYSDATLAVWTYLMAERPLGWRGPHDPGFGSPAAQRFYAQWAALAPPEPLSPREAWLAVLEALQGTPYVWGGKDPWRDGGLDCSGLLTYAARQVGLDLGEPDYTDAEALRRATTAVPSCRGALVAFHSTYGEAGPDYTTHIGVWLDEGALMLDSQPARGVGRTDIAGTWWQQHLQGFYWHPGIPQEDAVSQNDLVSLVGYLTHDVHDALQAAYAGLTQAHRARLVARSRAARAQADADWEAAAAALEAALATLARGGPPTENEGA